MRAVACLFALPLAALLLGSCHKEKVAPADQLPPATTTGADTFGYLLNGQPVFGSGRNQVRGDWTVASFWSCNIGPAGFSSPPSTGNLVISKSGPVYARVIVNGVRTSQYKILDGLLTTTRLDRQAVISSGTFWFTTVTDSGDTLRITNGRFDCHMDL